MQKVSLVNNTRQIQRNLS